MMTRNKLVLFALTAVLLVGTSAIEASAFCSTCATPVAAYRPVYTTAYAPVAYTTYRPYTGWYPGYWMDRLRTRLWGAPVAYTAAYYPATYSVGYASYAASYAPSTCSSCVSGCTTCGYASYSVPACSSCSTCTACYAPACTTCTTCCAPACADCAAPAATVTQAVYQQPAAGCANCGTSSAGAVQTYGPSATSSGAAPSPDLAPSSGQPPALGPTENPPLERSYQETQKPDTSSESAPLQPMPADEEAGDSANLQAPQLFDPSDRTAERHQAPVWTAVYHKPVDATTGKVYSVSRRQALADAEGWTSASE